MARTRKMKPKATEIEKATVYVEPSVKVHPDIEAEFDQWLGDEIDAAIRKRDEYLPKVVKYRKTIGGERATPSIRATAANISVPFSTWARTGIRARVEQGIFDTRPILIVENPRGGEYDDPTVKGVAKALEKLLASEIMNPRGLNGRKTIQHVACETTDFGLSAWKVMREQDLIRYGRPMRAGEPPLRLVTIGKVIWEFVSALDLVWIDGYGTDVNRMPLIGHQCSKTWTDLQQWAALEHYNPDAVAEVEAFYSTRGRNASVAPGVKRATSSQPAALRPHEIVEVHLDYDVDGNGFPEAIIVDWHREARKRLRTIWQYTSSGRRPFIPVQFDLPGDLTCMRGQGLMEKLEGAQDEIDMVHNIAVEGGKRAAAWLIALKAGSRAEEELGGDEEILPGDVVTTESPDEDIVPKQIGDSNAAKDLLMMEVHTRGYAMEILGMDRARLGDVEAGKRVSAAVGMTTFREGRVPIRAVLTNFAQGMQEACYLTIDLWRDRMPEHALGTVLTEEEIATLRATVFSLNDASVRAQYIITINAEDAATLQETRKQELLALNQFLFVFYEKLSQLVMMISDPNVPGPAKQALTLVVERMERGVVALLRTIDSLPQPEELLVQTSALRGMLQQAAAATTMTGASPEESDLAATDLGGGVA